MVVVCGGSLSITDASTSKKNNKKKQIKVDVNMSAYPYSRVLYKSQRGFVITSAIMAS